MSLVGSNKIDHSFPADPVLYQLNRLIKVQTRGVLELLSHYSYPGLSLSTISVLSFNSTSKVLMS